jgi:hypothetical protein
MEQIVKVKLKGFSEKQKEIARQIINIPTDQVKYHVIRASRKSGKTWLLARLALYSLIKNPGSDLGFMSASWNITQSFYRDFIKLIPEQLLSKANQGTRIELNNGSSIDFYSANSSIIPVNRSFNELYLDEFALYRSMVWEYMRPTIIAKPNAKVIVASTPRQKNAFFDMCMLGMNNEARHKEYRMHWTDNKLIKQEDIDDARKTMPDSIFRSEYLGEFVFGQSSVFGEFVKYQVLKSWQDPVLDKKYWGAIDWSGSGEDSTILTIINEIGDVVYMYECINTNIPEQIEELVPIIKRYNDVLIYSECNGLGLGATEMLQLRCNNVVKFWMSNESKNDIVSRFKINLDKGLLKLPSIDLYPKLDSEMCTYVVTRTNTGKLTYKHEKGFHDDTIDSLLMANYSKHKMFESGISVYDNTDDIQEMELVKDLEYMPTMVELQLKNKVWSEDLKYD